MSGLGAQDRREVREFVRRLVDLERKVAGASMAPRLIHSSIEDGSIGEYDEQGNLVGRIGKQHDGTHTSASLYGPVPPVPSPPIAEGGPASLTATWDGTFENDRRVPMDFQTIQVGVADSADGDLRMAGVITSEAGGSKTMSAVVGTHWVALRSRSQSGRMSDWSARVAVEVESILDSEVLDELNDRLDALKDDLKELDETTLPGLRDRLGDAFTEIEGVGDRADQAAADATAAHTAAQAAQSTAEDAEQAALDAAGIAEGKGQVITQTSAPAGSRARAENLWVRLPDHKVHVYDGDQWVAATDPDLIAAAGEAATARQEAQAAQSAAEAAQDAAEAAQTRVQAAIARGDNLIYNGDFEAGEDGWGIIEGRSAVITDSSARSGNNFLRLYANEVNVYPYSEWVPTSQGRTYYIEAWWRKTGEGDDAYFRFYTQAQTAAGGNSGAFTSDRWDSATDLPDGEWVKFSSTFTVESDATRIRFAPHVTSVTSLEFDVDDMLVVDITEAHAAQQAADDAQSDATAAAGAASDAQQAADEARADAERALASASNLTPLGNIEVDELSELVGASSNGQWEVIDDPEDAYQGRRFLRYTHDVAHNGWLYLADKPSIQEGRTYRAGAVARLVSGQFGDSNTLGILTTWEDVSGSHVNVGSHYPDGSARGSAFRAALGSEWAPISGFVTPPPGRQVTHLRQRLYFAQSSLSDGAVVDFDAVTFVDATDALEALEAADAAQERADEAHAAAGTAQDTADAAMTAAGTKTTVTYSTSAPAGVGQTEGDTHRQRDGSGNIVAEWSWDGDNWVPQQITSEQISNLDVGKLTAGSAAIDDLVAQRVGAAVGEFVELHADQIIAAGAGFRTAVITQLWTDFFATRKITANEADLASLAADEAFIADLQAAVVTAQTLLGKTIATATSGQRAELSAAHGLRMWNPDDTQVFGIDSATGRTWTAGDLVAGSSIDLPGVFTASAEDGVRVGGELAVYEDLPTRSYPQTADNLEVLTDYITLPPGVGRGDSLVIRLRLEGDAAYPYGSGQVRLRVRNGNTTTHPTAVRVAMDEGQGRVRRLQFPPPAHLGGTWPNEVQVLFIRDADGDVTPAGNLLVSDLGILQASAGNVEVSGDVEASTGRFDAVEANEYSAGVMLLHQQDLTGIRADDPSEGVALTIPEHLQGQFHRYQVVLTGAVQGGDNVDSLMVAVNGRHGGDHREYIGGARAVLTDGTVLAQRNDLVGYGWPRTGYISGIGYTGGNLIVDLAVRALGGVSRVMWTTTGYGRTITDNFTVHSGGYWSGPVQRLTHFTIRTSSINDRVWTDRSIVQLWGYR